MSPRTLLAAAALAHFGLSLHVLSNGHPIEDSYILYIYSESLASGHGITYFKGGEHAEGATDFLWMMLLGAGSFLGVDVAVAAAALNTLGLVVLGYLAIALLRRRYEGKTLVAASACALLGIGSSQIAAMSVAGFSAGLYSSVAALAFYILYTRPRRGLLALPYVGIVGGLLRPDGVILGVVASVVGFVLTRKSELRKKGIG